MFLFFSVLLSVTAVYSADNDLRFEERTAEGEKHYRALIKKSQSYGDCWKEAVSDLHSGCRQLTEDVQSRLALVFSNCFLKQAGSDPAPCSPEVPVSDCLRNASDRVFSTYTEFFTHTQSICHYLQHRQWQEEAAKTALALTKSSQDVSRKLDESSKTQSELLDLQRASLDEQTKLVSHSQVLNTELQQSRETARDLYHEFKTTTQEQRLLLFQVFDRMKGLQNFVLGELSGMYTVAYYVVAAALIYLLTSVPRTAEARIWLVLVISFNAALERYVSFCTLQEDALEANPLTVNNLLHDRIWLCRKVMCLVCLALLIKFYCCYRDYNVINNQLLQQIQQQNADIQNYIKGLTSGGTTIQDLTKLMHLSNKHSSLLVSKQEENAVVVKTGVNGREISPKPAASQKWSDKMQENKENIDLNFTPNGVCGRKPSPKPISSIQETKENTNSSCTPTGPTKKVVRKKVTSQKKATPKNNGNTPKTLSGQKILSELESPVSPSARRYNLRSSGGLKSPLSPSPYKI